MTQFIHVYRNRWNSPNACCEHLMSPRDLLSFKQTAPTRLAAGGFNLVFWYMVNVLCDLEGLWTELYKNTVCHLGILEHFQKFKMAANMVVPHLKYINKLVFTLLKCKIKSPAKVFLVNEMYMFRYYWSSAKPVSLGLGDQFETKSLNLQ